MEERPAALKRKWIELKDWLTAGAYDLITFNPNGISDVRSDPVAHNILDIVVQNLDPLAPARRGQPLGRVMRS